MTVNVGSLPIGYNFAEPVRVLTSAFSIHYSIFPKVPSPIPQTIRQIISQMMR
jgi:hypothetical protein